MVAGPHRSASSADYGTSPPSPTSLGPPQLSTLETSPSVLSDSSNPKRTEYVFPMSSAVSVATPSAPWTSSSSSTVASSNNKQLDPPIPIHVVPEDQRKSRARMNGSMPSGHYPRPKITSTATYSPTQEPSRPTHFPASPSLLPSRSTRPLPAFGVGDRPTSLNALNASHDASPPDVSAWMGSIDAAVGAGSGTAEDGKATDPTTSATEALVEKPTVPTSHSMSQIPTAISLRAISNGTGMHRATQTEAQGRLDSLLLTTRFKHIQNEQGNMILDGRSDRLMRCEDEPIHAPGAVQSFGVLIALREEVEGELQVQLVSENAGAVLGLTPHYLFGLDSFADCLDDEQADILWSHVDTAEDVTGEELIESGPQLFQLSVHSQVDHREAVVTRSCYAALHRAPDPPAAPADQRPTLILELELVDDQANPLETYNPGRVPESMLEQPSYRSSSTSLASTTTSISDSLSPISRRSSTDPKPLSSPSTEGTSLHPVTEASGIVKEEEWPDEHQPYLPTEEQKQQSTTSGAKPLRGLLTPATPRRMKPGRRSSKRSKEVDLISILSQANEQLAAAEDLTSCLQVAVGIVGEITGYSRVMVYKFDEAFNGQVVTELVSWGDTHDLYLGLRFPATDIPPQARDLYRINRTRLLYNRDQPTARLVARSHAALAHPLDMTHCMLRAMSPIHLKYLKNMHVRASLSLSVVSFGQLWGLIALHNYGPHGKRIAFPLRRLCRLLGDSISQNVERLTLAARLKNRQHLLGFTRPVEINPSGYFSSEPEELFHLFHADFGVISVGKEVKILGPIDASQEVLGLTQYLRLKRYTAILSTSNIERTFTDMVLPCKLTTVAGLLLIPLSQTGSDFMCFMRKPQIKHVQWAGNPHKPDYRPDGNAQAEANAALEPRKSFKLWMQTVANESLEWGPEALDLALNLSSHFGRFISIWRRQEQATQLTQLTSRLLCQARHDVRTPLHQILSLLEMSLDSPLDAEAQDHIRKSYTASRSLLHTVNELLDLTRQSHDEEVNDSSVDADTFDIVALVAESVSLFDQEAARRKMSLATDLTADASWVSSDRHRIRQLIINVLSNSFKNTASETGIIEVGFKQLPQPADAESNPLPSHTAMYELSISDNGKGMPRSLLESIFRALEEVTTIEVEIEPQTTTHAEAAYDPVMVPQTPLPGPPPPEAPPSPSEAPTMLKTGSQLGLGVGLAVVARTVKLLKGQLRVENVEDQGATFTFRFPFVHSHRPQREASSNMGSASPSIRTGAQPTLAKRGPEHSPDSLFRPSSSGEHSPDSLFRPSSSGITIVPPRSRAPSVGGEPLRTSSQASFDHRSLAPRGPSSLGASSTLESEETPRKFPKRPDFAARRSSASRLRTLNNKANGKEKRKGATQPLSVLVVDDNQINRLILKKRLTMDGHKVTEATDGQQAVEAYQADSNIDVVLMDLQMPILDGQGSTRAIRLLEAQRSTVGPDGLPKPARRVPILGVSATLEETMRSTLSDDGLDGWLIKPINFTRLRELLTCVIPVNAITGAQWDAQYEYQTGLMARGGWFGPILR